MKLSSDLREFIGLLTSETVEYVIVGGHAVAWHGYPRFTGDIDFFVRASSENAAKILRVLDRFGFGDAGLAAGDFVTPDKIVQLGRPPNRIDLLTSISGVSFEDAWGHRISAELDGLVVPMISRDDLVRNKRASGRLKDQDDVQKLEASTEKPGNSST
jgi:hypothetical protein